MAMLEAACKFLFTEESLIQMLSISNGQRKGVSTEIIVKQNHCSFNKQGEFINEEFFKENMGPVFN